MMAFSMTMITLLGLLSHKLFRMLRLPGLLGLLLLGMVVGPYGLNLIDQHTLAISSDLRRVALIIILLRAGLGISRDNLAEVGPEALKLSLLPCLMEGIFVSFLAVRWLGYPLLEAGMLGFLIAAVSPAVVVPLMLGIMPDLPPGKLRVPVAILAGASFNAVIAVTILSSLIAIFLGTSTSFLWQAMSVPLSVVTGLLAGGGATWFLFWLFSRFQMRHTKKVLILIGVAVLLSEMENTLQGTLPMASLLGIVMMGFLFLEKKPETAIALSGKLSKIWVLAEIMLFVMVGAAVQFSLALQAGWLGLLLIAAGLAIRSLAVWLSLAGSSFSRKETLFCLIANWPKATVQAAAGGLPLAAGAVFGEEILALVVLSILVTAPIGAIGIQWGSRHLL